MGGSGLHKEYTHPGEDEVRSISGGYHIEKEIRLTVGGREVLCLIGNGFVDSSCCGVGGCRFAFVPGYLVEYHVHQNDQGDPVSIVEPITDPAVREKIAKTLEQSEIVQQVNFE